MLITALLPFLAASLSASHDPLANIHVAGHSAAQEAISHSHDEGPAREDAGRDQHGHSAVDHVHETLFALPEHALTKFAMESRWIPLAPVARPSAFATVLERPPKHSVA